MKKNSLKVGQAFHELPENGTADKITNVSLTTFRDDFINILRPKIVLAAASTPSESFIM